MRQFYFSISKEVRVFSSYFLSFYHWIQTTSAKWNRWTGCEWKFIMAYYTLTHYAKTVLFTNLYEQNERVLFIFFIFHYFHQRRRYHRLSFFHVILFRFLFSFIHFVSMCYFISKAIHHISLNDWTVMHSHRIYSTHKCSKIYLWLTRTRVVLVGLYLFLSHTRRSRKKK